MPSNSMGKDQKFHTFKTIENVGPGSYNIDKPEVCEYQCRVIMDQH